MVERLIFVHIPKNAGTSIKQWGVENGIGFIEYKHKSLNNLKVRFPESKNLKSFAIVRNTYKRIISYYLYDKNMIKSKKDKQASAQAQAAKNGFKAWFEYCIKRKTAGSWSQLSWIKDVDYVLHVENLDEDFKIIQELTGCHNPLKRENVGVDQDSKEELYANEEIMEMIENHFKKEIEHFGYKRPKV